ncbi:MAG: AAA family ATPase, partial [Thermoanaerobaculia bacterium]
VRDHLDDVLQQIQTLQSLNNLQSQDPDLAVLLQEQRQTVSRKGDLLQRKDELGVEARLESTGIVLYSPAIAAEEVGVDLIRAGAVGLVLGLLIAGGTTYLLALKRRKFDDRSQPRMVFNAPLIAEVPNFRDERIKGDVPVMSHPASVSAEAFRFISSALEVEADQGVVVTGNAAHLADAGPLLVRSIAFVSPSLDDGKTVVAANTALASARHGKRVLAIDADFGHQRLTALLAGDNAPNLGLTDLVERDVSLDRVVCSVPMKEGAEIDLVSRGTVDTTAPDFFRSAAVKAFFEAIKLEYDLVLIDTPPLLHVAYASPLVRYADRVVVVLRHRTSVAPAEELADRLAFLETGLAGYVYNRAPLRYDMSRSEGSLEDVLGRAGQRRKSG